MVSNLLFAKVDRILTESGQNNRDMVLWRKMST